MAGGRFTGAVPIMEFTGQQPGRKRIIYLALGLLIGAVALYGAIVFVSWCHRPKFSSRFAYGETSSWFPGWARYPTPAVGSDGTFIITDSPEYVAVLSSKGELYAPKVVGSRLNAFTGDGQDIQVAWRKNQLIWITKDGRVVCRRLSHMTATAMYEILRNGGKLDDVVQRAASQSRPARDADGD